MDQPWILPLNSEQLSLELGGGKGANLARLVRDGFPVPSGFVLTTAAYRAFIAANQLAESILEIAQGVAPTDPQSLEDASNSIRARFAAATLPSSLISEIGQAYQTLGAPAVAVRSSATAEDLPDLSFAGQQDTLLNIEGETELLRAIVACWSSLWTARAIGYRARNGIAHDEVALAVVVQAMVPSEASGVLFTANPLTGRRSETVIDATLGLGEALVSGQVEPDHYVVDSRSTRITSKTLGAKAIAIRGRAGGGTITVTEDASARQALPDDVIIDLTALGQHIAALFGSPQDIEWAWAGGRLWVVQSRPITSLYPLPEGMEPEPLQVLLSFGAVQGVLDPITPLARDVFRCFGAAASSVFGSPQTYATQRMFAVAGERLFMNITPSIRNPRTRRIIQTIVGLAEPGAAQTLTTLINEPPLAPQPRPISPRTLLRILPALRLIAGNVAYNLLWPNLGRRRVQQRIQQIMSSVEDRANAARTLSERARLIEDSVNLMVRDGVPLLVPAVIAGMIGVRILALLAERTPGGSSRALAAMRGLPHNVTTEMDLALWQVAGMIKRDPASSACFQSPDAATLASDALAGRLPPAAQRAINRFLERYGMRGVAEIDIGRPRWSDNPQPLVQIIQSYLQIGDPAAAPDAVFARNTASAEEAITQLIEELRATRYGWLKARIVRWAARRMRALAGLRESPKFTLVRILGLLRERLLMSGREMAAAGVVQQPDDLFFLRLDEIKSLVASDRTNWHQLIGERRQAYAREQRRRQVPRLLLSDGRAFFEGVAAPLTPDDRTLVGSPVSPGVVEGIVHVVRDPHAARLAPGEILVCPGTDPAWTPLFLAAGGLVMEVGGLMTHGSVVAREYGIPAVVGVHEATTRLRTGQRICVDGTHGQIVLLT